MIGFHFPEKYQRFLFRKKDFFFYSFDTASKIPITRKGNRDKY